MNVQIVGTFWNLSGSFTVSAWYWYAFASGFNSRWLSLSTNGFQMSAHIGSGNQAEASPAQFLLFEKIFSSVFLKPNRYILKQCPYCAVPRNKRVHRFPFLFFGIFQEQDSLEIYPVSLHHFWPSQRGTWQL